MPGSDPRSEIVRVQDQFILDWGRMSSAWGINRTMAQIHALLFVSHGALDVNEIMDRLQISRGNASMNLRELMDWGIVRRIREPGDRKDMYVCDTEPMQMILQVLKERKRREIDPTTDAIREAVGKLPQDSRDDEVRILRQKMVGLLEIMELVDAAYRQVLANQTSLDDVRTAFRKPWS